MKITKKQIKALDKGETNVRELFPEVFEKELHDNTYYIYEDGAIQFNIKDGKGYGINSFGTWIEGASWLKHKHNGSFRKATEEEVTTALINEAKKKGFKEGVIYDSLPHSVYVCEKNTKINYELGYSEKYNTVYSDIGVLFNNGIWAEIIKPKQMTKQQIEKELGYNIEII